VNCTMEDYLKVAIPHLRPELVTPEALSQIRTLAKILPPFSISGLECRLGAEQSRVDLQVNLPYLIPTLPETFLTHPSWQMFQEISQEWTEPKSFLSQKVRDIWLEFDIKEQSSQVPSPCIFLTMKPYMNHQSVNDSQQVVDMVSKLLKQPVSSRLESNLKLSFDSLPTEASISHFGAMLSRWDQPLRMNVRGLLPEQLLDYLMQIGWKDSSNTLEVLISNLSELVDNIFLSCDIGETVLPKIGLECFLSKQPKYEPRWQLVLDYLVAKGLCTPAKQNALLAWPGFSQKASQPEIWPNNLNWGDHLLGSRAVSLFSRTLNHLKIVYQPDTLLEAKAYLAFFHHWLDASPLAKIKQQLPEKVQIS